MPKNKNKPNVDPLSSFVYRQVTAGDVHGVLTQEVNPFTQRRWSWNYRNKNLLESRKELPVFAGMTDFYEVFTNNQFIVVHGDTGSGKTTQIPQFVAYADLPHTRGKMIACTQTRRLAAISAARRVAEEMDVKLGKQVGYSVRFESKKDRASTFLLFQTDGMLLQEAMRDPDLNCYSTIILDEVHERTISTDILLGLLKSLAKRRPDLKVVIMSATMDVDKILRYFRTTGPDRGRHYPPLLRIPGRAHHVEIRYTSRSQPKYVNAAIERVLRIHSSEPEGDVLVFLTGEEEIEEACDLLSGEAEYRMIEEPRLYGPLQCLPLYSNLPQYLQQRIYEPARYEVPPKASGPPGRRVIIATNIAETSLTIPGIAFVVDAGYCKPRIYDPKSACGKEVHVVSRISRASAEQRAGRAGRTRKGKCYRLYTEKEEREKMRERDLPQVQTTNLAQVVLMLAAVGYKDPSSFKYLDLPDPKAIGQAQKMLKYFRAIDSRGKLTSLGEKMVQFPLEPQLAKMVIESPELECSEEVVTIAAMLSAPHVFVRPRKWRATADAQKDLFNDPESDHLTLLNVYNAFLQQPVNDVAREAWCREHFISFKALKEAESIRTQLCKVMERCGLPMVSSWDPEGEDGRDIGSRKKLKNVKKALVAGFFMQVAYNPHIGNSKLGGQRRERPELNMGGVGKSRGKKREYLTIKDDQTASIHPSSAVFTSSEAEWVIFNDFTVTKAPYIRTVTSIKARWLFQYAPEYYDLFRFGDGQTKRALETALNEWEYLEESRWLQAKKSAGSRMTKYFGC